MPDMFTARICRDVVDAAISKDIIFKKTPLSSDHADEWGLTK